MHEISLRPQKKRTRDPLVKLRCLRKSRLGILQESPLKSLCIRPGRVYAIPLSFAESLVNLDPGSFMFE